MCTIVRENDVLNQIIVDFGRTLIQHNNTILTHFELNEAYNKDIINKINKNILTINQTRNNNNLDPKKSECATKEKTTTSGYNSTLHKRVRRGEEAETTTTQHSNNSVVEEKNARQTVRINAEQINSNNNTSRPKQEQTTKSAPTNAEIYDERKNKQISVVSLHFQNQYSKFIKVNVNNAQLKKTFVEIHEIVDGMLSKFSSSIRPGSTKWHTNKITYNTATNEMMQIKLIAELNHPIFVKDLNQFAGHFFGIHRGAMASQT